MIHYITTNGIGNAWVANELQRVMAAGVPVQLHAMRKPASHFHDSSWARELHDNTRAIYPISPLRALMAPLLALALFRSRFVLALADALFGPRESLRVRVAGLAHFIVACHWALTLRDENPRHIHCQWIHSCGTIGMYGAWLLGISYSFTGHAADLFRERCGLRTKIRRADFIVCISTFHRDFYLSEGADPGKLRLAYCGIDLGLFGYRPLPARSDNRIRIRASGRLVEKKGFFDLIRACRELSDRKVAYECVIGGSGELEAALRWEIESLRLEDSVRITGEALKQEDIPAFMYGGDVYCLPCVVASDGDVDGLPQMLMEAMACGLPVISTRLVGIPDLVIDGETGRLVEPHDVGGLARAIEELGTDRELAGWLAERGRAIVEDCFDIETSLEPLIEELKGRLAQGQGERALPGKTTPHPVDEIGGVHQPGAGE